MSIETDIKDLKKQLKAVNTHKKTLEEKIENLTMESKKQNPNGIIRNKNGTTIIKNEKYGTLIMTPLDHMYEREIWVARPSKTKKNEWVKDRRIAVRDRGYESYWQLKLNSGRFYDNMESIDLK